MVKLLIHLPAPLKAKLDGLRSQGYTAIQPADLFGPCWSENSITLR